jgi:hypothetical protein
MLKQSGKTIATWPILLALVCGLVAVTLSHPIYADPDPEPDPLVIPDGDKDKTGQSGSEGTHPVEIESSRQENAARISVERKSHRGKRLGPTRFVRIKEIKYTDNEGNPQTWGPGSGPGASSDIALPPDADKSKPIEVVVEMYDENGVKVGLSSDPVDNPKGSLKLNFRVMNAAGQYISAADVGPSSTMLTATGTPSVTKFAASHLGLSEQDYTEPDLVMFSSVKPTTGDVVFVPIGEFRFDSLPNAIHVFDGNGTDLVNAGMIEVGSPSISERGELVIPVSEVHENLPAFAMIVRGVEVLMDGNADGDSTHGYTVNGSALAHLTTGVAAIADGTRVLDNWETHGWSPEFALSAAEMPLIIDQTAVDRDVGNTEATVVSQDSTGGFLDGLTVEGNDVGSIGTGKIVYRPLHGFIFQEHGNTELYIVDADTGSNLSGEVTASMTVDSSGKLVVTIDDLGEATTHRLKVVVVNLKVSFSSPLPYGVGYDLNIYGSALKSPMLNNLILLEGGASNEARPLPSTPFVEVDGWTPAATLDDE